MCAKSDWDTHDHAGTQTVCSNKTWIFDVRGSPKQWISRRSQVSTAKAATERPTAGGYRVWMSLSLFWIYFKLAGWLCGCLSVCPLSVFLSVSLCLFCLLLDPRSLTSGCSSDVRPKRILQFLAVLLPQTLDESSGCEFQPERMNRCPTRAKCSVTDPNDKRSIR